MKKTLADIQCGKFAQEWIAENKAGCPNFNKLREKEKQHPDRNRGRATARHDELAAERGQEDPPKLRKSHQVVTNA